MKNLTIFSLAILLCMGMQAQNFSNEQTQGFGSEQPLRISYNRGQGLYFERELPYEEKKARNISGQLGYIVTQKGNKIVGYIKIDFFDISGISGIANLDLRTNVLVRYTTINSKGRERTKISKLRARHVEYFIVFDENGAESRYEPVHRNVFGNVLSSTNVDLDAARKPYFQKVIYRKGDYTAYFDPSSEYESTNYFIAKRGEKANLFAELLRNGRVTRSIVGDCTVLLDKLEKKELTNCIEGIETFINLLIECEK